ncbi:unnamed protein product [Cunninghamella blakesleeana]
MLPYWKRIINGFQYKNNNNWVILTTWLSTLFLVCESVVINNNNDGLSMIGLPRDYHCALNYNNAFFVLGGQNSTNSLSMNFNNTTQTPPSIQWINNTLTFQQQQQQKTPILCTVTSYGQAIIFNEVSLQQSLLLDLNTFNWNNMSNVRRLSSFNISSIIATTITDDDQVLLLSNNNNTISSWRIDASNERLRWRISQLSSSSSPPPPPSINGGVQLIPTSSYILYFHIDQPSSSSSTSNSLYEVNVYGFDSLSMSWIGQLFNFTSATNDIHVSLIHSTNDNDTLLVFPTWIDKNLPSINNNNNNNQLTEHGYWLLNLSTNTSSSQINWHPLNDTISILKGGSMTKLTDDIVLFYGGLNKTNNLDSHSSFLFWSISNQSFLSSPSWLSALMPPTSSSPTPLPSTVDNNNNNSDNKLIIILATLLGVFGTAFLIMVGIFFWYRKNKNKKSLSSTIIRETDEDNSPRQVRIEEGQDLMYNNPPHQDEEKNRSPRFSFIRKDNAAIWSNQLQRALSKAFHQGNASSPTTTNNNNNNINNTNTKLKISAPITSPLSITTENINNDKAVSRGIMNNNNNNNNKSTSCPSLLTPSTSQNLSPNSARNSMHETASMTSRFVERI